jgi:UDP-N-acetylglucosamine 2-epimerase
MIVLSVVGARPQFIKAAVVSSALVEAGVTEILVHTGQHYDERLSEIFFVQLGLRAPDHHLGIGSASHGEQTGRMLAELERVIERVRPDRVLVYGDTNSTLAGALAAAKMHVPVDHVEAGLRSFDRSMPEEVNRVLTDHVSDQLLCPTGTAVRNLEREGIREGVVHAGDVMLDLALRAREAALATPLPDGIEEGAYFLATVHRPANTDDPSRLAAVMEALAAVGRAVAPVVLPAHPRLAARLGGVGFAHGVHITEPAGYLEMQGLILRARGVITDSGGVQKEAMFHGVRCLTLRDSTEWVESLEAGMNVLLGDELLRLVEAAAACAGRAETPRPILDAFGGGEAGARIAEVVREAGRERRRWRR